MRPDKYEEDYMVRIGVDVGGTNTDLVLECPKGVYYHKVPTTLRIDRRCRRRPRYLPDGGIEPSEVELIVHGTTTATNVTIEHNGSECGMLTTKGFRDILHIGRHKRPYNFSLHFDVPWQSHPLVKRGTMSQARAHSAERLTAGRLRSLPDAWQVEQAHPRRSACPLRRVPGNLCRSSA